MLKRILPSLLGLAVSLSGCTRSELVADSPPFVVLISIDTLRSDHLPMYGYGPLKTPALDALRQDSVLFKRAYAHSPMTLPSHVSMLTGMIPPDHGVRNNVGFRLGPDVPYLPCVMKTRGYATAAMVSSFVLRRETAMDRCFDVYDDEFTRSGRSSVDLQRRGSVTLERTKQWLGNQTQSPFFLFFHIYEPHVPYDPPESFRRLYPSPYDAEIAEADRVVGELLGALRSQRLYDQSLIILTSDHGEGLGDHGEEQHSLLLYREALQVPLLVKFPKRERAGEVVDHEVGHEQIFSVVDELVKTGKIPAQFAESAKGPVYSETYFPLIHFGWSELTSSIKGRHHYIHGPRPELYDVTTDPAERQNLIASQRRIAAELQQELARMTKPLQRPTTLDPDAVAKLAALGYIGSAAPVDGDRTRNPVDEVRTLEAIRNALQTAAAGKPAEAIRMFEELLKNNPRMAEGWYQFAELLSRSGDHRRAIEAYRNSLSLSSVLSPDVLIAAAYAHLKIGEIDQADLLARQVATNLPVEANELMARVAMARKDFAAASTHVTAARRAKSSDVRLLVLEAELAKNRGKLADALALLSEAEKQSSTPVRDLEFLRGDIHAQLERLDEAVVGFRKEIDYFPDHLEAYGGLAIIYFIRNEPSKLRVLIEEMAEKNPTPAAYDYAAKIYAGLDDEAQAKEWRRRRASLR